MNTKLACIGTLLASALILSAPLCAAESPGTQLLNPEFKGTADGIPDSWQAYPPASGDNQKMGVDPAGGVKVTDQDAVNGLGIAQWVAVTPGEKFSAKLTVTGEGAITLNLIFVPKIPGKAAMINSMSLGTVTGSFSEAKQDPIVATVPAGANFVRVFIYCSKPGKCDLLVKSIELKATDPGTPVAAGPATAPGTSTTPMAAAPPKKIPSTPKAPAATTTTGPELKNPQFQAGTDGIPDGWQAYPPPSGDNQKLVAEAAGGVRFTDQDPGNGLGLAQWVAVTPGQKYSAKLAVEGEGTISLNLIFVSKVPGKAAMIDQVALKKVTGYFSAAKQEALVATVPEGAQYMRVFVYCTKPGLCNLVVKSIEIKAADAGASDSPASAPSAAAKPAAGAPAGTAPAPASKPAWTDASGSLVTTALQSAPDTLAAGTVYGIDFETGDYSQCHLLEGGKKWIVSAPDPVRNGKHALKVMMTHDQHRTEITGPRSAPSGEYKYGWSIFLPETFDGETFFSIVTQWHTWGSGKDYPPDGGPPSSITISKNNWGLKIQHQDGEEFKTTSEKIPFGSITGDKGKWTDFYMEVNWQSPKAGGGYLRLWKNGEKVVDYNGPTWFEEKTKGPFFKMGVYKGGAEWKGEEDGTIIYFDEFHMGDKSSKREQIDPAKQPRS